MPGETLTFDIFANDRASETFRRLGLAADSASGDVKQLGDRLDKLGSRVTTARVGLEGNKEANVELDKLDLKLIRLGKKVANPSIDVEGKAKALADINAVDLAMDRLNKKFAVAPRPSLGARLGRGLISARGFGALFSGAGGAAGGVPGAAAAAAPAASPVLDFLGSPAGIGAAGGLAAVLGPTIAALVDAVSGFGVGALGAGAGVLGVKTFNPAVLAPGLRNIKTTLSSVFQSIGPSLGLMVASFGKFVQGIAPQLAKFFASTLPFMRAFFVIIEQAAKTFLPALTQVMQQMVSSGALKEMTQGFVFLAQGLADFIKELGPGFKAGAEAFRAISLGIKGVLIGLGDTFGWLGKFAGTEYHVIAGWWDRLRHDTAAIFDLIKSNIMTYAHDIVVIFNGLSRAAGSAWNILWDGIKQATRDGIGLVTGWFGGLPAKILHALFGLGHSLYAFGRAALNELWDGFKSIGSSILSWLGNLWNNIVSDAKKVLGIFSPSKVFYGIGKNMMLGLFHGIRDHASHAVNAAAGATGAVSGSAAAAQAYGRRLASAYGWAGQWADINAVAMRESGWRLNAQNPTSPAYGIAQFIGGPSEYYQYGGNPNTIPGQVTAFFNYIRQRYGNPAAAWQHELQYGNYDRGGWLKPGLTLAYNATGRDEQVLAHGGAGHTVNVYVQVGHGTHPVAAAQEIAKVLNVGARNGVKLRTSILGPG